MEINPIIEPQAPSQLFSHYGLGGFGLEGVEVLAGLGLTGRQARVYLAALKLGGGKVQTIADLSLVSRQEIYRLINGLQEMGLIQKNITNPTTYTATPVVEVTDFLLKQKTTQLNILTQQTRQLTEKLDQNSCLTNDIIGLKPCFGTIFESDRGKKYRQAITDAKSSIRIVANWRRFKQLNIHFDELLQGALAKGMELKIVAERPPNFHLPKWIKPALLKYSNFMLRTRQEQPQAAITIFDQTTVDIACNPSCSLTKGPDLWTTHPALTATCQAYFNEAWTSST